MKALGLVLLAPIVCAMGAAALLLAACHILADHDLDDIDAEAGWWE